MSISGILSDLVLNTRSEELPWSSYEAAKKMLLDTLGCAVAGINAPGINELISLERELSAPGNGSVLFTGDKLAIPQAAYCNSALIHAMDYDNNYPGADLHILSIVIPAALACAEKTGSCGKEVLAAIILGVEAAARLAKPYCKAGRPHSYFLTTSLIGGWGGVAAASRLLKLTKAQTVNAFGIYYAHTCGNREALLEKSLTKRIQPAIATRAALYSVLLSKRGFTGPEYTFEGKGGFYRLYTMDEPPEEDLFKGAGRPWGIEELAVKKFPTCGIHHPSILAAMHLKHKYGFDTVDIEKCEFFLSDGANTLVSMPYSPGDIPQISAQFSAPWAIAQALNKGSVSLHDFSNEAVLNNQATADLAARTIEVNSFNDLNLKQYPEHKPECKYIKVYLKNGIILEHEWPTNDIYWTTIDEVKGKFRECLTFISTPPEELITRTIDAVLNFEQTSNIEQLLSLLSEATSAK